LGSGQEKKGGGQDRYQAQEMQNVTWLGEGLFGYIKPYGGMTLCQGLWPFFEVDQKLAIV